MIGIIDYGAGNIFSISNALKKIKLIIKLYLKRKTLRIVEN